MSNKSTEYIGTDPTFLARVEIDVANALTPVTQADITSITRDIYKAATLVATTTVAKTTVIYDTLQIGDIWTEDDTGFNFKDVPLHANFATPGNYRVKYTIILTSGRQFVGWFFPTFIDPPG